MRLMKRFGEKVKRDSYNTAVIISAIYNTVRDSKKQKKPYTPEDFLPKKKRTAKELLNQATAINELFGGGDSRKAVE
jgi:hypothetical protein